MQKCYFSESILPFTACKYRCRLCTCTLKVQSTGETGKSTRASPSLACTVQVQSTGETGKSAPASQSLAFAYYSNFCGYLSNELHLLPPLLLLLLVHSSSFTQTHQTTHPRPRSSPSKAAVISLQSSSMYCLHFWIFLSLWLLNSNISSRVSSPPPHSMSSPHLPRSTTPLQEQTKVSSSCSSQRAHSTIPP